jgi:ABC-type multidrug transport system fused ATPase/permease subunit
VFQLGEVLKYGLDLNYIKDYYEDTSSEAELYFPKARKDWPKSGKLEIRNISVKYDRDMRDVLHDLSFMVEPF